MITIAGSWTGNIIEGGEQSPVPVKVSWSSGSPLALYFDFEGTEWIIGRDLIWQAENTSPEWIGEGEVQVRHQCISLYLRLIAPAGTTVVHMPWPRVKNLLSKTYRIAPQGKEVLDVDSAIEAILGQA